MRAPMTLRILLLEDVPADAALVERHLTKSGLAFVSERVDTRARFEEALRDFDPETHRVLAVNGTAITHYGYSREEFLALRIEDLRPAEDIPALHRHLATMPADYHAAGIWRHRKKDGTLIEVETSGHGITFAGRRAEQVVS